MHEIRREELRWPARVVDVDLERAYDGQSVDVRDAESAWCLIRRGGVPTSARFLDIADDDIIRLDDLTQRFSSESLPPPPELVEPSSPVSLTVVICTRNRIDGLRGTLASLTKQTSPDFEVLVVDNSADGSTERELGAFEGLDLRCVHEPLPGLSRARNRALEEVHTELIAWIDDDEEADPDWIGWLRKGFASPCEPAAVTGVMLPAELATAAQVDFERHGGFNKGRGMQPEILRAGTASVVDPFYPLPNFGAGGNMAFRTAVLKRVGGFDNRLGAGTLTHGGEETLALSLILDAGESVLHWPPAVTWHYHRRTDGELAQQFYGYSAGLTAYYMSLLLASPRRLARILGFIPAGIQRIRAQAGKPRADGPPADFPVELLAASRRGLRDGAWMYLRETWRQRRGG